MAIYWSVKNVVSYCLHFVVHLKLRNYFSLCFFLVHYCQGDDELNFWLFTETAPEQVIWNDQHDNVAATGGVLSNPLHQRSLHQQSLINAPIMNLFISKRYLIELSQATLRYRYDCFRLILWIQYLALIKKKDVSRNLITICRLLFSLAERLPRWTSWPLRVLGFQWTSGVGSFFLFHCCSSFFPILLVQFLSSLATCSCADVSVQSSRNPTANTKMSGVTSDDAVLGYYSSVFNVVVSYIWKWEGKWRSLADPENQYTTIFLARNERRLISKELGNSYLSLNSAFTLIQTLVSK